MKNIFKMRTGLKLIAIVILALALCLTVVACDNMKPVTLTFVAEGVPAIAPIKAPAGSTITPPANPQKEGFDFDGWYTNKDFEGDSVELPTVMPDKDTTYYAHFIPQNSEDDGLIKVIYEKNNPLVVSDVTIAPSTGEEGATVKVKDGADYNAQGYMFVGWSTQRNGLVSHFGEKFDGQYLAGDNLTLGDENVTLYAQWAIEIKASKPVSGEKMYFYYNYVNHGNGGIFRVREVAGQDEPQIKLGFVSSIDEEEAEYYVFTFYDDDDNGGTVETEGRIYMDWTYKFRGDSYGSFLMYDYTAEDYIEYYLQTDGYEFATIGTLVGIQTKVVYYGVYKYDEKYGDYEFDGYDEKNAEVQFRFAIDKCEVYLKNEQGELAKTEFDGKFVWQGEESGAFLLYDNGEMSNYRLELNGYGIARLFEFNEQTEQSSMIAMGKYSGTASYEDYYGEWHFTPTSGNVNEFDFILNTVTNAIGTAVPVYIKYDETYDVVLNGENGETLTLDGYGSAMYSANGGIEYVGYITVGETLVTFMPYFDDGNGNMSAGSTMYFNVNWEEQTFALDTTEYIINGTTLVNYNGSSQIIVIPSEVTEIASGVFNGKNIVSVTIPAGVTTIGARAFENNNTLVRAVFLGDNPISIDWSSANDPFRWPTGMFIIVVPEGRQDAYKTAWGDECKYAIKGSVEVTQLPEFEIEDGVLKRYNLQSDDGELIDLVIPDEVTEIAASVFKGLSVLRSVDLKNVTKVGDGAFEFCENLVSVNFANVQILEGGAFNDCINLGNVEGDNKGIIILPAIVDVGDNAFQGCTSLRLVRLGENLQSIGDMAFREINIYSENDTLFVEFLGDNVPEMGEKVFMGNIAQRIKVKDMDVAIKCLKSGGFSAYAKHLYVESGEEKGTYFDGSSTLVLDGRAELMGSIVMWYVIDGEVITFHTLDGNGRYVFFDGTYVDGVISFTLTLTDDGVVTTKDYNFVKGDGEMTYVSEDDVFTLVVNPADVQPENFADNGYVGQADAKLNGTDVKINVRGYSMQILGFKHSDGVTYDITFTLEGNVFIVSSMVRSAMYITNITAQDGSVMNVHITANIIYVYGSLNIKVGEDENGDDIMLPAFSDWGTEAQNTSANVYVFLREYNWREADGTFNKVKYQITLTLSEDGTTFTYEYQIVNA